MSIHVALHHRTTYTYDRPVALGPQIVRLRPAPHCRTPILSYSLKVEPKEHFINWQQDPQGNYLARLVFPEKTDDVRGHGRPGRRHDGDQSVRLLPRARRPRNGRSPTTPRWPRRSRRSARSKPPGPLLAAWLAKVDRSKQRTIDFIVGLNARLQQEIGYIVRLEPGVQNCEETLALAKGSCRDTGWLLVTILRHLGFAARFASGYLIQLMPDEKPLEGPEGPTHDFTDLHAWCEVYLPGAGWIGLDPTSGLLDRRRPHPARLHARAVERRADRGRGREGRGDILLRHDGDARARDAAHHQALHRRAVGRRCSAVGETIERDIGKADAAAHHGRRADLRVDRRHGRRRVEHAGAGAGEAAAGRRAVPQARRSLRHGAAAAFRPGQVVSRRAAAALGARLPLAQGRRADLARPASLSRSNPSRPAPRPRRRNRFALAFARASAARSRLPVRGLRGHLVLPVARTAAAEQRHGRQGQGQGPAGARAPGAGLRAGSRELRRLRAAGIARPWARQNGKVRTAMAAAGAAGRGSCARRSAT